MLASAQRHKRVIELPEPQVAVDSEPKVRRISISMIKMPRCQDIIPGYWGS